MYFICVCVWYVCAHGVCKLLCARLVMYAMYAGMRGCYGMIRSVRMLCMRERYVDYVCMLRLWCMYAHYDIYVCGGLYIICLSTLCF